MQWLKTFLIQLYGVYAAVAVAVCLVITGLLLLVAPGLRFRRRIARFGLRTTFYCAGMPFKTTGVKQLPEQPCIAIANHRSYLDGLVLIAALPPQFTPVIKAEVGRVPIIGLVLRRVGARYVQREPAMTAGRDTKHLLDALRNGESLAIFPEGTFSLDEGLLPFRGGAFFLAAKAGVAIIPVAIEGSSNVLPPGHLLPRPACVEVDVLQALYPDGAGRSAAQALRDSTEDALWRGLKPRALPRSGRAPGYAYYSTVFRERSLPQAYLDLDLLEDNIRTLLNRSGGKRLRVDASALRCPAVIDRVLRSNIRFQGVKCATGAEAVYFGREWQWPDILVAYPVVQRDEIARVCQAVADGCNITMTADSPSHLSWLSEAASAAGVTLPICMEIDLSATRSSRRSPLRTPEDVWALLRVFGDGEHLRFRGVLAYDSQSNNTPDWFASPRRHRLLNRRMNARTRQRLYQRRREVSEKLASHGYSPQLFNGGDLGGIEFNAADPSITEISVGLSLLAPVVGEDDFQHAPAAGLALEVVRRPANDVYVCLGGGYATADAAAPGALPQPYLPAGVVSAHTEEGHMPIRYGGELRLGDAIFLCPPHAGELCERFSKLALIQGGTIVDSALTYRALGEQLR